MAQLTVERDVIHLWKMQFLVERELRRISRGRLNRKKQSLPAVKLVDELEANGNLAPVFARMAKRLLSIMPRPARKKALTVTETRLIYNVAPDAVQVLQMFPTRR
jgi:hypothetical protein